LSGLAFIDSSGLSVLATGLNRLRAAGGDLALRSPSPATMKALEITGLTSVFAIGFESGPESNNGESHGVRRALLGHG
nr:STAS domain-containing protein [Actinomycetota bacterium]